jgi:hypothetical protein
MADETGRNVRDDRTAPRRGGGFRRALPALLTLALLLGLVPLSTLAAVPAANSTVASAAAQQAQSAFTSFDDAGDSRDLGGTNPKDYMTVSLTLTQQSFVRVSFTGYAFAKSSAPGVITPGCPCLVRGELRVNEEARQIVTRQVVASDANDIVGDPSASPAVAAADRRDLSGSNVYSLAPGTYSFTMSLRREVGTAQNVGFGFGRMQAEVLPGLTQDAFTAFDDAGDSRDLAGTNPKDYMTVRLTLTQPSFVRASFTGYAFAKAGGGGVQTPGCPCLVRGELRANNEARQIVTRTVLATDANDVVADPNASPPVAAADRAEFSGSQVYELAAGSHTFTMSLRREVGTAENVGFGFGRMQATVLSTAAPAPAQPTPATTATATPRPQPPATAVPAATATMAPMPGLPNTGVGNGTGTPADSGVLLAGLGLIVALAGAAFALRRRAA